MSILNNINIFLPNFRNLFGAIFGLGLLAVVMACSDSHGLPELRPGRFDKPKKTETHGRIVEKHYSHGGVGVRTKSYKILEVKGKPVRIPDGYVERTKYCEVKGIDAVAFTVRGDPEKVAGQYILQLDGDDIILERVCDYRPSLGSWEEAIWDGCEVDWDANQKQRIPSPPYVP